MMKDYKILKEVGRGAFSVVKKAVHIKKNKVCAVKEMNEKFKSFKECTKLREVKSLMKKEKKLNKKNLIKTIGLKELKNFLLKRNNMNTTSELTLQATRNYAKRQYTWFRHQFSANIIFKETYKKKNKKYFLKEIQDKLLTN